MVALQAWACHPSGARPQGQFSYPRSVGRDVLSLWQSEPFRTRQGLVSTPVDLLSQRQVPRREKWSARQSRTCLSGIHRRPRRQAYSRSTWFLAIRRAVGSPDPQRDASPATRAPGRRAQVSARRTDHSNADLVTAARHRTAPGADRHEHRGVRPPDPRTVSAQTPPTRDGRIRVSLGAMSGPTTCIEEFVRGLPEPEAAPAGRACSPTVRSSPGAARAPTSPSTRRNCADRPVRVGGRRPSPRAPGSVGRCSTCCPATAVGLFVTTVPSPG